MRFQIPKLTPLQSRFAASLFASCLLLVIYLFFSHSHFAYAADANSLHNEDHNHHRLLQDALVYEDGLFEKSLREDEDDNGVVGYEASFPGANREIIGRAAGEADTLRNNQRLTKSISANATDLYVFAFSNITSRSLNEVRAAEGTDETEDQISLLRRQDTLTTVNITITVCFQPTTNSSTTQAAPALTMFVSTTNANANPGPGTTSVPVVEGYAFYQSTSSANAVHIGVSAPTFPDGFSGDWNYEIAASMDTTPFHVYEAGPFNGSTSPLFLVDSDLSSALIITKNVSGNTSTPTNHALYIFSTNSSQMGGLSRSYCAVNLFSNATAGLKINRTVTQRFADDADLFREQFFVDGLSPNTNYTAVLALPTDKTSTATGGGGTVWAARSFMTKSMNNCQLIFDLDFCSETAYSVPANTQKFENRTALAEWYDSSAQAMYQNFNYTLQQVPCNTTDTAMYSLARNCDHCTRDYKRWLCAVSIPRCTDFNLPDSVDPNLYWYRKPRNLNSTFLNGSQPDPTDVIFYDGYPPEGKQVSVTRAGLYPLYLNSSRLPAIDGDDGVQPGPYREILPCIDLCHHLVQSCPATLGFGCPLGSRQHPMQSRSYGLLDQGSGPLGEPMCNMVGALYEDQVTSAATRGVAASWLMVSMFALVVVMTTM